MFGYGVVDVFVDFVNAASTVNLLVAANDLSKKEITCFAIYRAVQVLDCGIFIKREEKSHTSILILPLHP